MQAGIGGHRVDCALEVGEPHCIGDPDLAPGGQFQARVQVTICRGRQRIETDPVGGELHLAFTPVRRVG